VLALFGAVAALAAVGGCRGDREDKPPRQFFPDMDDSPKFKPQTEAPFFADNRSMRPEIPGTVPFGRATFNPVAYSQAPWARNFLTERDGLLREDRAFFQGVDENGDYLNTIPFPVTREMILRGQERFNIYCSACHGFSGDGQGMVGRRWATVVANFHDPKYSDPAQRTGKDGYLFYTIRHGVPEATPDLFPKMPPYGHSINEADTWAIVSYIRVLQQWQGGTLEDVPAPERDMLSKMRDDWRAANPPKEPAPGEGGEPAPQGGGTPK
jgi:mono/diheme cytochrome c family protein